MTMIQVKRMYDPPAKEDGARFLVERLWPRGTKKGRCLWTPLSNDVMFHQCLRPVDMLTADFDE
jgi:uncharacterized protein YeaO (DUF488 family)